MGFLLVLHATIPGYLFCRVPWIFHHASHFIFNCLLALSNSYPKACVPVQGGSLYHFYGGLWYDPAGMRTHDLRCEKRTRLTVQPDWLKGRVVCEHLFTQFYLFGPYTESGQNYLIPAPTWKLCVTNSLCDEANREIFLKRIMIAYVLYSGTPFERSP